MKITSISNIQSSLATLQENLPAFRKFLKMNYTESMDEGQWGDEKEYSPNGVLSGLNNIITDLISLVENPKTFILLSTYKERRDIHEYLSRIAYATRRSSPSSIVSLIEHLKRILRSYYNMRTNANRMIVFEKKLEELAKQSEHLIQVLEEAREKEKAIDDIHSAISEQSDSISRKEESIYALLKQSEKNKEELDKLQEELEIVADEIRTLNRTSSEAKEQTIAYKDEVKEFVEEIGEYQKKIKKQDAEFKAFQITLDENTTKQQQYLSEAHKLIEDSKVALSYTTSVGLSSSFDAQCKEIKGWKSFKLWSWLVASAVGVIGVICIGVWLIYGNHHANDGNITSMWMQIIGKISMIPLLVTTIVFCANQYGKQKNLLEDYSYKLALAKSMVAFSEELREKDSERYKEYLSTVLNEILKDPLRTRIDPNKNKTTKGEALLSNESLATFEKIISLIQQVSHTS